MKNIYVLFDMDGVVIDSEAQYDHFWIPIAERYNIETPNFDQIIKGTTVPNILKKYFPHLSDSEKDNLMKELEDFESKMDFPYIPGAFEFISELKENNIKIGLVTSSLEKKLTKVNEQTNLIELFDTIVSGNRVVNGKPNPECYLLAAKDLGADPKDCIVFEDAFAGIEAGTRAGMTVIGLSTTNDEKDLADKCKAVIPDFTHMNYDTFLTLIE